jgi:hypothetical protein
MWPRDVRPAPGQRRRSSALNAAVTASVVPAGGDGGTSTVVGVPVVDVGGVTMAALTRGVAVVVPPAGKAGDAVPGGSVLAGGAVACERAVVVERPVVRVGTVPRGIALGGTVPDGTVRGGTETGAAVTGGAVTGALAPEAPPGDDANELTGQARTLSATSASAAAPRLLPVVQRRPAVATFRVVLISVGNSPTVRGPCARRTEERYPQSWPCLLFRGTTGR